MNRLALSHSATPCGLPAHWRGALTGRGRAMGFLGAVL